MEQTTLSDNDLRDWIDFSVDEIGNVVSIFTGRPLPAGTSGQQTALLIAQQRAQTETLLTWVLLGGLAYLALK